MWSSCRCPTACELLEVCFGTENGTFQCITINSTFSTELCPNWHKWISCPMPLLVETANVLWAFNPWSGSSCGNSACWTKLEIFVAFNRARFCVAVKRVSMAAMAQTCQRHAYRRSHQKDYKAWLPSSEAIYLSLLYHHRRRVTTLFIIYRQPPPLLC